MKGLKQRIEDQEVAPDAAHRSLTIARKLHQVEGRSCRHEAGRQGGQ
jgi:hypothetical protein